MKLRTSILLGASCLVFSACANHSQSNLSYENNLTQKFCDKAFLEDNLAKAKKQDDTIYRGLNAGLIAKNCGEFKVSNEFFDLAEESYKWDVDLQNIGTKGAKTIATTLINDNIVDYEGSLYERIMVNAYKGLNFMSLGDYENARVEFNRALMRQDKAKEYFAKEIDKNRKEVEEAKKDPNYKKNMSQNTQTIQDEYAHLWKEFDTTKNFTNPYATYLASVFFYMDRDYRKAAELFREVSVINPKNKEIRKESAIFQKAAKSAKAKKSNLVFVVYENGFGTIKDEFSLTLPFVVDKNIVTTSVALQTLKKREASYENLSINGAQTSQIVDLDNIVATEFKINMPSMIAKALAQTITKTALNVAVAKNDKTGGWLSLASSALTTATNSADVRAWRGLPKSISVVMLENNGTLDIKAPDGTQLYKGRIDKNKSALVMVRSFNPSNPVSVNIIQK
ncbi:COG3014 family protein [Helicobacter burdigaliensis]|uniref:COG3014 family protein n=1 Tax=Helicobacter burdigaliensis TaxID=2315334 RepID=UPI000EF64188|nr:hypothetical protein [Helicobacter burdigaliensis]